MFVKRIWCGFKTYKKFRKISTTVVLCKKEGNRISDEYLNEILTSDRDYNELASNYFHPGEAHTCLLIQPYVKWGPQKLQISPTEQLDEGVALIKSLPLWQVEETVSVGLDTLDRKSLFKSGTMERFQKIISSNRNITAIFVNLGNLTRATKSILQENFSLPIFDRYRIVMEILKIHATSKHAKLQVALAELYYVQKKAEKNLMFAAHNTEAIRLMFQNRERKLKNAIQLLRNQRALLRNKRRKMDYPVIAVVGYTNAGKTCLIKTLTGEDSLQPRDQLFATLDVTLHSGILPSGLEVLYVDTVGFISDIPTNLIECFVATLEDAILSDVILHVEDISSSCFEYKRNHVLTTLKELGNQVGHENIMGKVIHVGNKCDLINNLDDQKFSLDLLVSAKAGIGLDKLRLHLEDRVLKETSRQKIIIKVLNGGDEIRWLYKNATVIYEEPDKDDPQYVKAGVIITQNNLLKFKHYFISK